jgi:hypothetical protein
MGTSLVDLKVILGLREENFLPARFSVAEIGAQQLSNDVLRDPDILAAYARAFGVTLRTFGMAPPRNSGPGVEHLPATAPFAKAFWDWLGCPYVAIDYDRSPHIIPLDLNFDDVPAEHRSKYLLVTNFGTTEHVINQFQALKIVHDLTAPGGVMIHTVPTQGYRGHGFVRYNPEFFLMLARSCRYECKALNNVGDDPDICLQVVLRKTEDIAFVPPMEIHAGLVDDPKIRSRYWTVLD